jgi:hypothetical protein
MVALAVSNFVFFATVIQVNMLSLIKISLLARDGMLISVAKKMLQLGMLLTNVIQFISVAKMILLLRML